MKKVKLDPTTGDAILDDNGDATFEDEGSGGSPIFPNAAAVPGKGLKPSAARVGLGVVDLLNLPSRALATTRGMEMSDPNAYFLRPEVEKLKADTTGQGADQKSMAENYQGGAGMAHPGMVATPKEFSNSAVEFAGRTASDPMALLGPLRSFLRGAGGKLKETGKKITEAAIKPDVADQAAGFNIDNLFKNNLGGSHKQMKANTIKLRNQEGAKLGAALKGSSEQINAVDLWAQTVNSLEGEVKKGNLSGDGFKQAMELFRNDINEVADPTTGMVSAEVGDNLKRRFQKNAKALYKAANVGGDIRASEKEIFARSLAGNMRGELEKKIPAVIEPNRILHETVGIKKAVDDAVKRTEKNNPLSLTDIILLSGIGGTAGGPGGAAAGAALGAAARPTMFALNRASKSPWVGNKLHSVGDLLESAPVLTPELRARLRRLAVARAAGTSSQDQE